MERFECNIFLKPHWLLQPFLEDSTRFSFSTEILWF